MNYRHAFHAGNFADVFKHAALCLLLDHLSGKDKPFAVIDTHAGPGRYDLEGEQALRTGEAAAGIGRLAASGPLDGPLRLYADAVRAFNPAGGVRIYPGSPLLARHLMRPSDRLVLAELHPEDGPVLKALFAGDDAVQVRLEDGYKMLKAQLPPRERRGLVLIDPPFEAEDEFLRATRAIKDGLARWATGVFVLWYPIKAMDQIERVLAEMTMVERPTLAAHFMLRPPQDPSRLNGAGLLIVNPPWRLAEGLSDLLAALTLRLGASGTPELRWLREAT